MQAQMFKKQIKIYGRYLWSAANEARLRVSTTNRSKYSQRSATQDATQARRWAKSLGMSNRAAFSFSWFSSSSSSSSSSLYGDQHFPLAQAGTVLWSTATALRLRRTLLYLLFRPTTHRQRRRRPRYSEKRAELLKTALITVQSPARMAPTAALKRHEGWVRDRSTALRTAPTNDEQYQDTNDNTIARRCGRRVVGSQKKTPCVHGDVAHRQRRSRGLAACTYFTSDGDVFQRDELTGQGSQKPAKKYRVVRMGPAQRTVVLWRSSWIVVSVFAVGRFVVVCEPVVVTGGRRPLKHKKRALVEVNIEKGRRGPLGFGRDNKQRYLSLPPKFAVTGRKIPSSSDSGRATGIPAQGHAMLVKSAIFLHAVVKRSAPIGLALLPLPDSARATLHKTR